MLRTNTAEHMGTMMLAFTAFFIFALTAVAQVETPSRVSIQGRGPFTTDSNGDFARFRPHALGGAGALLFNPTDDAKRTNSGVDRQTKTSALYGGGANFDSTPRIGFRCAYRGLLYKIPFFKVPAYDADRFTHLAQPSVGIFFRF